MLTPAYDSDTRFDNESKNDLAFLAVNINYGCTLTHSQGFLHLSYSHTYDCSVTN